MTDLGLQAGTQYLCGDALSAADVAMGTEINRWSLCVHAAASSGLELKKPDFPCLKMYYSELMGIPSFVTQVFENERVWHLRHHFFDRFCAFVSSTPTPHAPCAKLYQVPLVIGC